MGSCRFDAIGAILVRIGHGYGLCLGFRVTELAVRVEFGSSPGAEGGSVAEWLACWTREQYRAWIQIAVATLSGSSLRQIVHTHRASVHQAAKFVAALLRVARVTAGLAESNGSLPPGS